MTGVTNDVSHSVRLLWRPRWPADRGSESQREDCASPLCDAIAVSSWILAKVAPKIVNVHNLLRGYIFLAILSILTIKMQREYVTAAFYT